MAAETATEKRLKGDIVFLKVVMKFWAGRSTETERDEASSL